MILAKLCLGRQIQEVWIHLLYPKRGHIPLTENGESSLSPIENCFIYVEDMSQKRNCAICLLAFVVCWGLQIQPNKRLICLAPISQLNDYSLSSLYEVTSRNPRDLSLPNRLLYLKSSRIKLSTFHP